MNLLKVLSLLDRDTRKVVNYTSIEQNDYGRCATSAPCNLLFRISVDLIPSKVRNSVYSLFPSLIAIIGVFLLPIVGFAIQEYGLVAGILILQGGALGVCIFLPSNQTFFF